MKPDVQSHASSGLGARLVLPRGGGRVHTVRPETAAVIVVSVQDKRCSADRHGLRLQAAGRRIAHAADDDTLVCHGACQAWLSADGFLGDSRTNQIASAQFLFFGAHNILQEAIVNLLSADGMKEKGTLMLGYAEIIGVLSFSYLERTYMTNEGGFDRVAPLSAYPMLTMCLFASSSLCNLSLSYINYPTKVGE